MKIYYNPKLKELARKLRNDSTKSEIKLWKELRNRQFYGYKFTRQKPIENFIVDFYCNKLALIIELDGYSHNFEEVLVKDEKKQGLLEKLGLKVLRFEDKEVMEDINNVLKEIEGYVLEFERHTPNPSF
jgi:very-short-patch-repair endonuclease